MSSQREAVHPLFIPRGSVRALVTLAITSGWCYDLVRGVEAGLSLSTSLFIVLSYYFAHRGGGAAHTGEPSGERPPLWLPRGSVRTLLVLGMLATVVLAWRNGQLLATGNRSAIVALASFFGGVLLSGLYKFRRRNPAVKTPFLDLFDHLKALAVLGAAVFLAWGESVGLGPLVEDANYQVGALGAVAFYFGSR